MPRRFRSNWFRNIEAVLRSRHYYWLGHGLGGDPVEQAMATLTADIMHICKRRGISWQRLLEQGRDQFEREEAELQRAAPPPPDDEHHHAQSVFDHAPYAEERVPQSVG